MGFLSPKHNFFKHNVNFKMLLLKLDVKLVGLAWTGPPTLACLACTAWDLAPLCKCKSVLLIGPSP